MRNSGRYPLCGRGDVNTFAIFAENMRHIINSIGRVGCIVPSGIATDDTTKFFFQNLILSKALVSLYDFDNREKIFLAVDSRMKFCLLTLSGSAYLTTKGTEFVFFAHKGLCCIFRESLSSIQVRTDISCLAKQIFTQVGFVYCL